MGVPDPDLAQLRVIFNRRRHDAGMTFEQLADASGISRQTLLNLSSGKYHGEIRTWLKLARVFGVTLDDLLAEVWTPEPTNRS